MTSADSKILRFCLSPEPVYLCFRLLLVVVAGVAAYSNTFGMSFNFDDFANIINNPVVKELNIEGLKHAFKSRRAFGIVTFQFNYFFSGVNVFGYHLVNIIIHIATALLVYAMISLLMKTPYFDRKHIVSKVLPVPFFAALLFVVHPVESQAVTYIVQRYTSLATLLYLVTIVCYLKARICQQMAGRSICIESGWFGGFLVAGFLAIYTKEIAYTWPIAILLVEILFFDFNRSKMFKIIFALFASVSLLLIKLLSGQLSVDNILSRLDDLTRIQTISSRSDYLFTQFRVIVTYLKLLFLPINQSVDYDYTLSHSFFEWRVFVSFLLLMTIFLFSLWLINASKERNPYFRLSAFGILWFFLTLSVESSIMPIIDLIFEHRVYLPSIGFFISICSIGLFGGWESGSLFARQKVVLGLLFMSVILAGATWKRNLVWTNDVTLWKDATVKKPNSARAWNNLGGALIAQRDGEGALHALIKSIELDPSKSDAWNNVGMAIDLLGVYNDRFNRTKEMFSNARAVENKVVSRWLGNVNNNLGLAYEILGNLSKAEEYYRNAVAYYPSLGVAYYNLALVAAKKGDFATTEEQKQILWLIDPLRAERLLIRLGGTATTR